MTRNIYVKYFVLGEVQTIRSFLFLDWMRFFFYKKVKETDIKGEFVFVLCFQIYLLEIMKLFVAGYVELDQRMKLLQISEIQASYLIIVHFTILFILLRKLLYLNKIIILATELDSNFYFTGFPLKVRAY